MDADVAQPVRLSSFGHAGPDGVYRQTHARGRFLGLAIGPDGNAWVPRASRARCTASTPAARSCRVGALPEASGGVGGGTFATGPDGTLWLPDSNHRSNRGTSTATASWSYSPLEPPPCAESYLTLQAIARASDGAMWFADFPCRRVLRATAAGASAYPVGDDIPHHLAASTPRAASGSPACTS